MCGCDPATTHKITSTIIDGIPAMPPAEQYCREYHEKKVAEERDLTTKKKVTAEASKSESVHPPYGEKQCDSCHDKTKPDGLVRPRQELCFICHPDIIKEAFVHGPASVGGCLECHVPHSSQSPSLLKREKSQVCGGCHREKRITEGMHTNVMSRGMLCMDCHNPHAGSMRYFLR